MQLKLRRWTKGECSPSDTPPILLPGICLHRCHSRPTRFARTRRSVTAWQTPGSLRMSGDAQSGSAFHLLPAVSHKLKNPCPACRLRGGIMCGRAQGVPARSVLHLQKDRCLEGAGKAALELDAACPSLTLFLFHVYSNASCGRQFQTSRRFFGPYKKQRGLRNSRNTPTGTPRAPQPRIPRLALPHVPSTQNLPTGTPPRPLNLVSPGWNSPAPLNHNPHLKLPRAPSTTIPHLKLPAPLQPQSLVQDHLPPPKLFLSFPDSHSSLQSLFFGKLSLI